jgi:serine phosphatase RsbU (regulator of sigma subunit)
MLDVSNRTADPATEKMLENADGMMDLKGPKILVVDDDPMNVDLLEAHLTMADYEVVATYCGEEALVKVETEMPDLILLDAMMPGLNGFDVCKILKGKAETMFIPIVMVTALSEMEDKIKAIESGADEFLTKPVNSLELLTRLKSLIRIKNLHNELMERKLLQLRAEKELFQRELKIAQEIQQRFLPDVCPNIEGLELAALTLPAGELRTNFYDFVTVSRDKLGLVVAHFSSGMGVPGVLFMALSRALIRANVVCNPTVSDAIYQANDLIINDIKINRGSGIFGTLFYALIDLKERSLTYSGTCQPEIIERTTDDMIVLEANGIPLGVSNALNIEENCTTLSSGDTVVLYTNGLVKAVNEKGEEFKRKRLMQILENNQDSSAQDIIKKIKEKVLLFTENTPMSEDITLIALGDKGAQKIPLDAKRVRDYITLLNKHL